MKNLCSGTQCGGFQFLLILDLWGVRFHAVVVFGLGKNLLFKSVLGHCVIVTGKCLHTIHWIELCVSIFSSYYEATYDPTKGQSFHGVVFFMNNSLNL